MAMCLARDFMGGCCYINFVRLLFLPYFRIMGVVISYYISCAYLTHDDAIKWRHFSRHWLFVRGIHRSPANSPHKGQWHVALMFSLICAWTSGWVNNRDAANLKRHRTHYDVTVMRRHHSLAAWIAVKIYAIQRIRYLKIKQTWR